MNDLTELVYTLCHAKRMKMKELADAMGISPVTLSRNLAKGNPRTSSLEKLADAFGVEREAFIKLYHHPEDYEISHKRGSGDVEIVPKSFNAIATVYDEKEIFTYNEVTAVFGYQGKLFYAYSLQDAKDITNILEMISKADNKEQEDSLISLLVNQYGKKKED